jgi:hypothetical protein
MIILLLVIILQLYQLNNLQKFKLNLQDINHLKANKKD